MVAPPGSGKTVLGLEIMQRIDKKALVLAPTLTIRNQWYDRMDECFVKDKDVISVSFDIKNLAEITFTTYQSLHSFFKNDCDFDNEKLIAFFADAGIETLVLDEAHHLKNEWWKPLFTLKSIPNCTIVALTATPPYDSDLKEITKYFDLCGPIDMEIGIPELVREGNICPHQDYVYFSKPDEAQIKYILTYRQQLFDFVNALTVNEAFIQFILKHPFYHETAQHLEAIYKSPELYSAILIFLHAAGIEIDKTKTDVLGIEDKNVNFPALSYTWIETLLTPFLIDLRESYIDDEAILLPIEKQLRKIGALDKKRINLVGERSLYKTLSQSPSKLASISEIVKLESTALKSNLRMVVLSDYIRKEFLEFKHTDPLSKINKLGVVPIFQYLLHHIKNDDNYPLDISKLGVLTGSLVIIHNTLVDDLSRLIDSENFSQEILYDSEYVIIKPNTQANKHIVSAMTQLFESGKIEVLVGTKSLLGEGWDAPAINTLLLASFVGSFVMSNQMRGRAIRVNPAQKNKVANIWHIACLDPTSETGGADLKLLSRRFEAFCGVSLTKENFIENGFDRLNVLDNLEDIDALNTAMKNLSFQRANVTERWEKSIGDGATLVRELKLKYDQPDAFGKIKKVYFKDALKFTLIEIGALFTIALPEIIFNNILTILSKGILYFFYAIVMGFVMVLLPKTIKAVTLYFKYGRRDKELEDIASALLEAMIEKKYIAQVKGVELSITQFENGDITCCLLNASAKEGLHFVNYLQEIIDPINNPRYMIVQSGWLRRKLGFANYYAVPSVFGERKAEALLFFKHWKKTNKNSKLLFTRNLIGRKQLLKARFQSYQEDEKHVISKKALIWK
ncbi:hypothetical protein SCB49_06472 [unidentified eubacterium SCB49]|nr:hypothetical protein SCB49_06472 [unidentified eubacterium SCB49]